MNPRHHFPRLAWDSAIINFPWKCNLLWPPSCTSNPNISQSDWDQFGGFVNSLNWKVDAGLLFSYTELAVLFLFQGFSCEAFCNEHCTFRELIQWFKLLCSAARKQTLVFTPGQHDSRAHHSWGKTMPSDCIVGAAPFVSNDFLLFLIEVTRSVTKAGLDAWDFLVSDFRCP